MGDRERALEARDCLEEIDPGQYDGEVADSYRQALVAVETFVDELTAKATETEVRRPRTEKPEDWEDDDAWDDAVEAAYEKADITRSKGAVTTKTIDDRDYYYLQWRDGDSVKSQYIGPVDPA